MEWILFTTVSVTEAASAWERIEWYRLRWIVEYHKALKTGCAMEQRQLQSAQGLLALVAVRMRDSGALGVATDSDENGRTGAILKIPQTRETVDGLAW